MIDLLRRSCHRRDSVARHHRRWLPIKKNGYGITVTSANKNRDQDPDILLTIRTQHEVKTQSRLLEKSHSGLGSAEK